MTYQNNVLGAIEYNADSGYGHEVLVEITGELGSARTASGSNPILRQEDTVSQAIERPVLLRWARDLDRIYRITKIRSLTIL
ncbi:MAG: hypothetical protein GY759_20040 [Chloroflexi bacterium]|nr:hypothetical protein [Chloroflexota bacterium]